MRDAAVAPGCWGVWVATGWSKMTAVAEIKYQNVLILSSDGPTEEADVKLLKKMGRSRKQTVGSKNERELSLRQAKAKSEQFRVTFMWACRSMTFISCYRIINTNWQKQFTFKK
jgi:hypothetical protein